MCTFHTRMDGWRDSQVNPRMDGGGVSADTLKSTHVNTDGERCLRACVRATGRPGVPGACLIPTLRAQMRRKIHAPRVILLDCPLEYKKGESQVDPPPPPSLPPARSLARSLARR